MKNYITINQKNLIKIGKLAGIKVDAVDGILFDWIQNFTKSNKALKMIINNNLYIWVSYRAIREDNPLCHINNNDVVARRLNKLVELGILGKYTSKKDGNKTFFTVTEFAFTYLLESRELPTQKSEALPTQKSDNSKLDNRELNRIKKNKKELPKNLNLEAFKDWCEYKGKSYGSKGKSLSAKKLAYYSSEVQQEMVNRSIMNNYKGLFEVRQNNNKTEKKNILDLSQVDYDNIITGEKL